MTNETVNKIIKHCETKAPKGSDKYVECVQKQIDGLSVLEKIERTPEQILEDMLNAPKEKTFLEKFLDPETGYKQFSRDLWGETIASWTTDGVADGVQGVVDSVDKFKAGDLKAAGVGIATSVARATPIGNKVGKVYDKAEDMLDKVEQAKALANGELPSGGGKKKKKHQKKKEETKKDDKNNVQVTGKQFSACGDREKYGKSKKKKQANNGEKGNKKINFHRDHIPADSVMQARAKDMAKAKGKKVCSKAKTAIRDGATTTMLPDFIHIDGRTYGGKVKRRFEWDKNNLGAAAKDDIQAVKDATQRALKKKKISKKCAEQINAATEQMAKKSKAYTDMISKALDLCK